MAHYVLHLTFNWQSDLIPGTDYYPLGQKLFDSGGNVVPEEKGKEKVKKHEFQHGDTVSFKVFRIGEQGTPVSVTFVFNHAVDCPSEASGSARGLPGGADSPFSGDEGSVATWQVVGKSDGTGSYWGVAGTDPKIALQSKIGNPGETWYFAIYLEVDHQPQPKRTFRFDPELVVDPW